MEELCSKTAVELRNLVVTREISAVELLEAHLRQIEAINPRVNAIVTLVPDHAMKMAAAVDQKLNAGQDPGILAGLPIAHKDLVPTAGIRTTFGSRLFAQHVPTENALIVNRINSAGAITLGKTNTPEWGAGSQTFNEVFGQTRNPWDLSKTPGGSSGGAAAALASRMLPIADGSDMGGSLRNPASFCNVVGFRVSAGRVPVYPTESAWSSLSVLGPMARTVADCALLLAAIAGPDPRSPISLGDPGSTFLASLESEPAGLNIALSADFAEQIPVAAEVQHAVSNAGAIFESMGCSVELDCPDFSGADEAFKTLRAWSFAAKHMANIRKQPDMYKETIRWNAEQGAKLSGADVANAEFERTRLYFRMISFFEQYDYLVLPVAQVTPFSVDLEYVSAINDTAMETYVDWMKSCYFVSATGLPAISIPCGFSADGLPIGIQIIGPPFCELELLRIAYAFESETQFAQRLPSMLRAIPQ